VVVSERMADVKGVIWGCRRLGCCDVSHLVVTLRLIVISGGKSWNVWDASYKYKHGNFTLVHLQEIWGELSVCVRSCPICSLYLTSSCCSKRKGMSSISDRVSLSSPASGSDRSGEDGSSQSTSGERSQLGD